MNFVGYNYRLTDIQCALGISQLNKIDYFIKKRRKLAKLYDNIFKKKSCITKPKQKKNSYHSYHLYPLLIDFEKIKISKEIFIKKLEEKKIFIQVHYVPVYKYNYYKKNFKINLNSLENSENFYKKQISLPLYFSMKKKDIYSITKKIFEKLKI